MVPVRTFYGLVPYFTVHINSTKVLKWTINSKANSQQNHLSKWQ